MIIEKITKIDNSREADRPREKHVSIELTDQQHRENLEAAAKLVYIPPKEEEMSPNLQEKFKKAQELTKETKVIKLKKGDKDVRKARKNLKKNVKKWGD